MNRSHLRATAGLLVAFVLAACSDSPSAANTGSVDLSADPRTRAPATAAVFPSSSGRSGALAAVTVYEPSGYQVGDTTVVPFSVNYKKEGVYMLGRHWIYFQPMSICDPLKTAYGEGEWNNSCQPAKYNVPITAKIYADSNGRPIVTFEPHLRFDPTKYVILHMTYDLAGGPEPKILWFKKEFNGGNLLDEAEKDEALITQKDGQLLVYRRIKHFSGYVVSVGYVRLESGTDGGTQVELGFDRTSLREIGPQPLGSGHVVATGAVSGTMLQY